MATSTDAIILDALTAHLTTLVFSPTLAIAHPGVEFPAGGGTLPDNYLKIDFLPAQTRQVTIGSDPQQKRGVFQVTVYWLRGQGLIDPLDVAGQIIGHFRNRVLFASGTRITISSEPWAASPLEDDVRLQLPVSIPYYAFEPEN
jgi:hypothetical protein